MLSLFSNKKEKDLHVSEMMGKDLSKYIHKTIIQNYKTKKELYSIVNTIISCWLKGSRTVSFS